MTKSFARQRAQRFQWQKLVTPFTSKSWVAEMESYEKDLSLKKVQSGSVAATVDPIDWDAWASKIETEGVVAELKAEYEAMTFAAATGDGSAITAEKEASMVAEAEADVRMAEYELKAADKVLAFMTKAKNEGQTWTHEQWEAYIPGYNSQFEADYENGDYLPSEAAQKMHVTDFKEVQARIKAGDKDVMAELEVDDLIGNVSTKEESELIANKQWSIARLFADAETRATITEDVKKIRGGQ